MFVIDWNLARYLAKTYCVRKCKKADIENLIIVAHKGGIMFIEGRDRHKHNFMQNKDSHFARPVGQNH